MSEAKTNSNEPINNGSRKNTYEYSIGLTKREYFAAMAMNGVIENGCIPDKIDAERCVVYADKLIEALNK